MVPAEYRALAQQVEQARKAAEQLDPGPLAQVEQARKAGEPAAGGDAAIRSGPVGAGRAGPQGG